MLRKVVTGLAVASLISLGLAACGSSGTSTSKPKATTLTEEANVGVTFTQNFNPFDTNSLATQMNMRTLMYEPLLQFNSMQPGVIHNWLAVGYTWSNSGKTLTLKLRPDVKWSDGQAFTATDVVFTFNLINQNVSANYSGVPPLASASAPDPATAVLNFKTPQYANLYAIAGSTYIVPEHIWTSITNPATSPVAKPVGTGPYVLSSFSTQVVKFTANKHYWGGTPPVTNVNIPSMASNQAAATALAAGQLDFAGNAIANVQSVFVSKDPAHNHYWFAPANTVTLWINVARGGPLADPKVRQAISAGIDRQELSVKGESGYEAPASSSSGLILPNQSKYLTPQVTNDLPATADAAKVASLLTSAGYAKNSKGIWAKNGKEISFAIEDPTAFADYYACAQLIANQLKKVGINATVDGVATPKWFTDFGNGAFDTMIHWGAGGPFPYQQYQNWLDARLTAPMGKTAPANFGRWVHQPTQAALTQYETSNDPAVQTQATQALGTIVSQQMPVIPLMYGAAWAVYSTARFTGWPTQQDQYMNPSLNDPQLPYILMHLKPVS
jgi:ABC-type transport system substrate-binding protein